LHDILFADWERRDDGEVIVLMDDPHIFAAVASRCFHCPPIMPKARVLFSGETQTPGEGFTQERLRSKLSQIKRRRRRLPWGALMGKRVVILPFPFTPPQQ
jgi:hypothetical protein